MKKKRGDSQTLSLRPQRVAPSAPPPKPFLHLLATKIKCPDSFLTQVNFQLAFRHPLWWTPSFQSGSQDPLFDAKRAKRGSKVGQKWVRKVGLRKKRVSKRVLEVGLRPKWVGEQSVQEGCACKCGPEPIYK